MSDSKTYVFGEGGGSQNFDPNLLYGMMMGGGGMGGFGGGNWLWPLLLFALWGGNWGGFGGGRGNLSDQINSDAGRDLLMSAIHGNDNAINQLACSLNCTASELRTAINSVNQQICNLGNQVGMSTLQVVNAINSGDAALARQLCDCCCDIKSAIAESNYLTERGFCNTNQILSQGFSSVAYAQKDQTCALEKAIEGSTSRILEGQRAAEMREMQDKIDALREKNAQQAVILNNAQQTSQFAAMLAPIQADLAELKCNQLPVKKIACPEQYLPINTGVNATYGLIPTGYGCGCGFGFGGFGFPNGWNSGNLWG